jgi:hypothetical protein
VGIKLSEKETMDGSRTLEMARRSYSSTIIIVVPLYIDKCVFEGRS